jgi:hypothetical protein
MGNLYSLPNTLCAQHISDNEMGNLYSLPNTLCAQHISDNEMGEAPNNQEEANKSIQITGREA